MQVLKPFLLFALLTSFFIAHAQYKIEILDSNSFQLGEGVVLSKTSFRGLSVVDDNTIWASGSRGTIARSIDGGKTFTYTQLKGYEKSDFRDIEAFDEMRAIIMSSGTPALILKTTDGGQTWKEVFRQNDSAYFLDAMDFWDEKRGMLVGDPINGHFVLLQTTDGGETWQKLDTSRTPKAMEGEAVFAASGTSLRCWGTYEFGFVTGGQHARWFTYYVSINKYNFISIEIVHGKSSQGIFSFTKSSVPFFVGGDYLCDTCNNTNAAKAFWPKVKNQDMVIESVNSNSQVGYRSCVEDLRPSKLIIACGTRGVDIYTENSSWISISESPFHVVRKAKNGKSVFLAGPNGKIGKLIY
jgi:photosystem II stability/assembly factor-like uncharacterized protein